jgi:hypothetical protein
MTYLLTVKDIPYFWEAIKKTVKDADEVQDKDLPSYLTELLHSLLSSNAQCFIRLSDEKILEALAVTRIMFNKQTNEKYMFVQTMYSWQAVGTALWQADIDFIHSFAVKEGCRYISCQSSNPRIWKLCTDIGFIEINRSFSLLL